MSLVLSIDESIQRLKAEVIAQDWRISPKRVALLEAAFDCLKKRFKNRRAVNAILIMAANTLLYIKKKGDGSHPDSIDFLKEAMAHIVNLYEEAVFKPEKEEKTFNSLYSRFNLLKQKIQTEQKKSPGRAELSSGVAGGQSQLTGAGEAVEPFCEEEGRAAGETALPLDGEDDTATRMGEIVSSISPNVNPREALRSMEVENLVLDLKASLDKAEEVGNTLRQLLDEILVQRQGKPSVTAEEFQREVKQEAAGEEKSDLPQGGRQDECGEQHAVKACPATVVWEVVIGGKPVAIQDNVIAAIRPLPGDKREAYLKNSNVPLKDFGRFLQKLSKQFKGSLSSLKDGKLKKISLPVMTPRGFGLPEIPDENAGMLVVVNSGPWNGVILCADVGQEAKTVVKFQKVKNGDIVGKGFTEGGETLLLLNIASLLRREGFLLMV